MFKVKSNRKTLNPETGSKVREGSPVKQYAGMATNMDSLHVNNPALDTWNWLTAQENIEISNLRSQKKAP